MFTAFFLNLLLGLTWFLGFLALLWLIDRVIDGIKWAYTEISWKIPEKGLPFLEGIAVIGVIVAIIGLIVIVGNGIRQSIITHNVEKTEVSNCD